MARRRRRYISGAVYELCFRAREGIPLPPAQAINALILAILARAQRDSKVIVCQFIWNGNHVHMLVICQDRVQLANFLKEVQKRICDSIKKLLGKKYLNLWEPRATVARIDSLEDAASRIAYFYENPSKDNLEDSIDAYPGFSTFTDFERSKNSLNASLVDWVPHFRVPALPTIGSVEIGVREELAIFKALRRNGKTSGKHALVRQPNAWMKVFGVQDDEAAAVINEGILRDLRAREQSSREKRRQDGKTVIGASRLRRQPIMKSHTPKKKERKIFLICSDKERRIAQLQDEDHFNELCEICYRRALSGDIHVEWPPGAFRPPIPPNHNLLYNRSENLFFGFN